MAVFTALAVSITGAATGSFIVAVTAAALQVAAGVALSLIAKAIAGEPEGPKFGVQARLQGGDDVPRSILFGYNTTAGSLVYANTWGTANGVPNAYLTQVIALADYPIRELLEVEVNGIPDTLATSAHISYGYPVLGYRKGGVDHLWVKFYDGTQTTADSFLTGTVSSTARPYTSSRVGRGVPYVIVTAMAPERKDGDENPLFSNGTPRFKFTTNGAKLYDITKDSTAGGTGTQRWNDPSTWGGDGDFLPMVQAYNILRGIRYGGQWLYGLQSLPAARLPAAKWIEQIDKCRAEIEGPDGDEPTYRSGGEIQVGAQVKVALETILTTCQGRLAEIGGTYVPHVGEPPEASMTLVDADIISTEEQRFTPFYGLEDTINGIQATYPNPAEGWKTKTAPPLIRTDLEELDGNRRLMANVSLDMVPYTGQVQRLMLSALREAQRARRHTFVVGPEYWVLEPGDVIEWTSERNGYVSKLMRVDGMADRANLDVMLDLTEVDPSDYDWDQDTDFTPVVDGPLQLVETPPLPAVGWQVYPHTIMDETGSPRRPAIEVWFQSGLQGVRSVRVQVRVEGEAAPFFDGEVPYGAPFKTVPSAQFSSDTRYEARGIYILENGGLSDWSEWLAVTTPSVMLGPKDVAASAVIGDVLNQMGQIRQLIEQFKEMGSILEEADRENYIERQTLARELRVQMGDLEASFTEIIEVALGPGGAIATALESLYAAMGGNTSEVNVRWQAVAAPTGYSARYAVQAAVNDGTFRSATFFLDVPADPDDPTRIGFAAGQTVFFTSGGDPIAVIDEDGYFRSANDAVVINMLTGDWSLGAGS